MNLNAALILLSALIAARGTLSIDESCKGSCSPDSYPPACGVWLRNETHRSTTGTYELSATANVELSCSFSSLPEPVHVQWMFKPAYEAHHWKEFSCARKEEKKICETQEKIVDSKCLVRLNDIRMSGAYRCEASIPNRSDKRYRAFSSEFHLNIVGIEQPRVLSSHLPINHHGHIELEVCANPRPEVFWSTPDGILRSGESTRRMAATALRERRVFSDKLGPATTSPYCYATRLLLHKTHRGDSFRMIVRGELSTITERLSVVVKSSPSVSPIVAMISLFVFCLLN